MASIHDLPEEILLKMVNFLELKEIAKFGEVSKRMRAISRVQSLWQKINLLKYRPGRWSYEIDVPTDFLKMAIENGCQYLSLRYMKLGTAGRPISMTSEGDFCLDKASNLKYLDLKYCDAHVLTFEEILGSCHSLQKLSMASNEEKKMNFFSPMENFFSTGEKKFITSKMITSICYQNGHTLQTLDLSFCSGLDLESIQKITKNCVGLKTVDLVATGLSKDSITFLVNNLTPKIEKVGLGCLPNLTNEHVKTLVARCNKISVLNLQNTTVTNDSMTHIIENLQYTLEKLHIFWCVGVSYAKIIELKSMPKLRVLNCDLTDDEEKENLKYDLLRFGESICVDERELSPADGIWDVEVKQLGYFEKLAKCQFRTMPNEIITHTLSFLERRDVVTFGQVDKRMRFFTQSEI